MKAREFNLSDNFLFDIKVIPIKTSAPDISPESGNLLCNFASTILSRFS